MRIWRVKPPTLGDEMEQEGDAEGDGPEGKWTGNIVGDFDDHKFVPTFGKDDVSVLTMTHRSAVGRVEWNITG